MGHQNGKYTIKELYEVADDYYWEDITVWKIIFWQGFIYQILWTKGKSRLCSQGTIFFFQTVRNKIRKGSLLSWLGTLQSCKSLWGTFDIS